jgi:putative flippase GtrA
MTLPKLVAKYSLSGLINTVVGYAVIFACMAAGVGATLSNILGYAVGLVISFLQTRYWVFRSAGRMVDDVVRFVPAFLIAFAANFLTLQALLGFGVNAYIAQFAAGGVFIAAGFFLNHLFVFRQRKK